MSGLTRKTPLKRTGFQRKPSTSSRGSTLKSGSSLNRRSRVNPVSAKTLARRDERDDVRETTLARDRHQCTARALVPGVACSGRLDVDEFTGRGRDPGSQYDDTKTQTLCRLDHRLKTDNPRIAGLLGLHGPDEQRRRLDEEGAAGLREALAEWARRKGIAAGAGPNWGGSPDAVARLAAARGVELPERWNP